MICRAAKTSLFPHLRTVIALYGIAVGLEGRPPIRIVGAETELLLDADLPYRIHREIVVCFLSDQHGPTLRKVISEHPALAGGMSSFHGSA